MQKAEQDEEDAAPSPACTISTKTTGRVGKGMSDPARRYGKKNSSKMIHLGAIKPSDRAQQPPFPSGQPSPFSILQSPLVK